MTSWWKTVTDHRQRAKDAPSAKTSGDRAEEIKPDRKGWAWWWRQSLKDRVQKGERNWVAVSLFYQFQLHRWQQSTVFQGTCNHKTQFCSSFSTNLDRRQSSPFPESVCPSCIPQRLYCRKGRAEIPCVWWDIALPGLPQKRLLLVQAVRSGGTSWPQQELPTAARVKNPNNINACSQNLRRCASSVLLPNWSHRPMLSREAAALETAAIPRHQRHVTLVWASQPFRLSASRRGAELPLKGTEMLALHWHLLTAVF